MLDVCDVRCPRSLRGKWQSILHITSRDDWIHVNVPYLLLPNTYYIIFPRAPTANHYTYCYRYRYSFLAVAAFATCAASVPFILKLFKLVIQPNTYNFTIMAIVAVLLIATFRYISSSRGWRWWRCTLYIHTHTARTHIHLHIQCKVAWSAAHSASHTLYITDAEIVTPACLQFFFVLSTSSPTSQSTSVRQRAFFSLFFLVAHWC